MLVPYIAKLMDARTFRGRDLYDDFMVLAGELGIVLYCGKLGGARKTHYVLVLLKNGSVRLTNVYPTPRTSPNTMMKTVRKLVFRTLEPL